MRPTRPPNCPKETAFTRSAAVHTTYNQKRMVVRGKHIYLHTAYLKTTNRKRRATHLAGGGGTRHAMPVVVKQHTIFARRHSDCVEQCQHFIHCWVRHNFKFGARQEAGVLRVQGCAHVGKPARRLRRLQPTLQCRKWRNLRDIIQM